MIFGVSCGKIGDYFGKSQTASPSDMKRCGPFPLTEGLLKKWLGKLEYKCR